MAENTAIEWADDTVGFWWGCTEHGPECSHCYARDGYSVSIAETQTGLPLWQSNSASPQTRAVRMKVEGAHETMRRLNRKAEKEGRRRTVFINSQADTFEDSDATIIRRLSKKDAAAKGHAYEIAYRFEGGIRWHSPTARVCLPLWTLDDERREMFQAIDECPWLNCLLLTKRPENIRRMWPAVEVASQEQADDRNERGELYRPNVWLGTSAGTQETADRAIPELLKCRDLSPVLFVSAEPLLGPVDFHMFGDGDGDSYGDGETFHNALTGERWMRDGFEKDQPNGAKIDWVIVGGESGPKARPMHPQWAREIRDQCEAAGVAYLFKQWGEWGPAPSNVMTPAAINPDGSIVHDTFTWKRDLQPGHEAIARVGKKAAGRLLDGVEHNEFPTPANA